MKKTNSKNTFLNKVVLKVKSLHWIDLLGIVAFLAILSIAFFFFLRKADYAYLTLRITQSDDLNSYIGQPPIWYVEKIKEGLQETDGLGRPVVVVEKVYRYKSSDLNQEMYVDLKVKSVYNSRTKQYSYNGSTLLVGSFQSFKMQDLQLYGIITNIRDEDQPIEEKTFIAKGYVEPMITDFQPAVASSIVDGVANHLADYLQPGLQSVDVDGKVAAEILEVRKSPGKRSFISGSSFISVPDPDRQKIEMTIRVKTVKINDAFYYKKDTAILLNSTIYLTLPKANITMTITELEEEK